MNPRDVFKPKEDGLESKLPNYEQKEYAIIIKEDEDEYILDIRNVVDINAKEMMENHLKKLAESKKYASKNESHYTK